MAEEQNTGPSAWYYVLGAAFIVAGVGFFTYTLLNGLFHITDSLTQMVVPGEADLTLQPKLEYTIFVEQQSVVNGRIFSVTENLSGLRCHVRSGGADGAEIALRPSHNSMTYNINGRSGRSVLEFDTGDGTAYHLSCAYEEGQKGPQAVVAVGAGVLEKIFSMVMKCLGAMFAGMGIGLATLIVVSQKRRSARKRLAQGMSPPVPG